MAAKTVEKPPFDVTKTREQIQEEVNPIFTWKMPDCTVGMPILWYRDADVYGSVPQYGIATFVHPGGRAISVIIHGRESSYRKEDVRHVDDPILESPQHQMVKAYGAWDYSPDVKAIHSLEQRVNKLEGLA